MVCRVGGINVMVMCLYGSGCTWPLLLLEQPTFAFVDHVCIGEVGLVAIDHGAGFPN